MKKHPRKPHPRKPHPPRPRYNNPDGSGHGSGYHDGGMPAYRIWCAARQARRQAEIETLISI